MIIETKRPTTQSLDMHASSEIACFLNILRATSYINIICAKNTRAKFAHKKRNV